MKALLLNLKAVFELPDNITIVNSGDTELEIKNFPGKDVFIDPIFLLNSVDFDIKNKDKNSLDKNYLASMTKCELVELSDTPPKTKYGVSEADHQIFELVKLDGEDAI